MGCATSSSCDMSPDAADLGRRPFKSVVAQPKGRTLRHTKRRAMNPPPHDDGTDQHITVSSFIQPCSTPSDRLHAQVDAAMSRALGRALNNTSPSTRGETPTCSLRAVSTDD